MTFQDFRKRAGSMLYLGFDESKKMWVYSYQDLFKKERMYGLLAGEQKVIELSSIEGLNLTKI